ncbi:MAG: FkbM family methyltransferase [Desulfovibrio sp.]|nr:FkbM family methyltransferase [Desulfovibrio sp.]
MISKTKAFYDRLLTKAKTPGIVQRLKFADDPDVFKKYLLASDSLSKQATGDPVIDKALEHARETVSPRGDPQKIFVDFILDCFHLTGALSPMVFLSDDNELLLFFLDNKVVRPVLLEELESKLSLPSTLEPYASEDFINLVQRRSEYFYDKFAPEKNPAMAGLIARLGDEDSLPSLTEYLNQRYRHYIHAKIEMFLTRNPPACTNTWREERRALNLPKPLLAGVTPGRLDIFYNDTFVMEQYGIPACQCEEGDVVIDAGAYAGDSALYFAQKTGKTGKVYAFEPIPENLQALSETIRLNKAEGAICPAPFALSDGKRILSFSNQHYLSSPLEDGNASGGSTCEVKTIDLDTWALENGVDTIDFLKCDIEGAEMDFLKGAKGIIIKHAPKCGLAVYHKLDDILDIPARLLEYRPDYKFYFRMEADPVLFAKI